MALALGNWSRRGPRRRRARAKDQPRRHVGDTWQYGHPFGKELQGFRVAPLRVIDNYKERPVTRLQPGNFQKTGGQATFALDQIEKFAQSAVGDTDAGAGP